jgi:DNA polymerase-3 subunit alpha
MMDDEEAKNAISAHGIPVHFIDQAIQNTQDWAKEFDGFKLKYDWRLPKITDKPTKVYILDEIRRVGRMDWKNPVWVARLKYEMSILIDNGTYDFGPYFFPIAGVFAEYKTNRRLTGPGRGSVTGSLMSYVMGITHIDPIDYDLPFERFFSMDRIVAKKLPDVDIDLPNRDLLVGLDAQSGLLYGTYGDKAAQVSTRGMLRLKSSIADVNRNFNNGVVDDNVKAFAESLPAPPQGVNDRDFVFGYKDSDGTWHKGFSETSVELQTYMASRPDEWAIVRKMLGIPRQHSRHASAFVIADVPVTDVIPTMTVNGVSHVTQYEAKEVESAGLIKYDFLSLSTLIDLEGCLNRINARNGKLDEYDIDWFDHEGVKTNIWRLPKTDDKTAKLLADGHLEALFQVGTNSMRPFVLDIQPKNIVDCAVVLALVRPGPLDYIDENLGINMAQKYVKLRKGELQPDNATLARLLPESYGVIVFQEQLTKIARDLAMMPGDRAEILRDNMCKKRKVEFEAMKPEFMEKATQNASKEDCEMIWNMMATFGQYGFSVNHATAYAAITWATAFLKAHYPLEFWASVLTNADNKEINEKYWKFVHSIVAPPDINVSSDQFEVDYAAQKVRSKMTVISGLGDKVMERVMAARPFDGIEDFVRKGVIGDSMTKKLIHVGVMDSLFAPDSNLIDKMQAYEDAVQKLKHEEKMVEYHDKVKTYEELLRNPVGKKPTKPKEPVLKRGTIDPKYLSMSPYEDYSAKKEVLPSMPSDLTKLTMDISSNISKEPGRMPVAFDSNGRNSRLVNGAICRIYENRQDIQGKRDFFACAGMVLSAKVFTMKKKGTQAFKLLLETDGHIRELVKWPDYDTNELKIPDLKKGDIVFCFFDQKPGRPPRIADIVVEYSAPKASKK